MSSELGLSPPVIVFRRFQTAGTVLAHEIWIRTSNKDFGRAVSQCVVEYGWRSLEHGETPIERIVVNAEGDQPTLDEMLAALLVRRLLVNDEFPPGFGDLAKYAAQVRQGRTPTRLPAEDTLEGIFLAIRNSAGADLTDDATAGRFLERWNHLAACLERAVREGVDVYRQPVCGGSELADERADLLNDERRYQWDISHGQRWTVRLPGTQVVASGLYLEKPKSRRFAYWSRRDLGTPTGSPYVLLVVGWGKGEWVVSTDPALEHAVTIESLAVALQQAEEAQAFATSADAPSSDPDRAWYDGRDHRYTMIAAPKNGTRLSDQQVLKIVKQWAGAKEHRETRHWSPTRYVAVLVLAVLATVGLAAGATFYWLPEPSPDPVQLYRQVAPAVVLVRTDVDQGTGFFIADDGWLVTNYHVVKGARANPQTGMLTAHVQVGRLSGDAVALDREPVAAIVYKSERGLDLALLKLERMPVGVESLPFLELAVPESDRSIVTGAACWSIGNAAIALGLPNQFREGRIEAYDEVDAPVNSASDTELTQVIQTSCNLAKGDSGSPLVDGRGRVIGVAFATPEEAGHAFHVHVDDLVAFLGEDFRMTSLPKSYVPDEQPPGTARELQDYNHDGDPETLRFRWEDDVTAGLWIALPCFQEALGDSPLAEDLKGAIVEGRWAHQISLVCRPYPTVFYDTDGSGDFDLILQSRFDRESQSPFRPDIQWRRGTQGWAIQPMNGNTPLVSIEWLTDAQLRESFSQLTGKVESILRAAHD